MSASQASRGAEHTPGPFGLKRIVGVKWRVQYQGEACIAAYRGPDRCRLFLERDMTEIKLTPDKKLAVDALVDAAGDLAGMEVYRCAKGQGDAAED